jgi:hypothetical protein
MVTGTGETLPPSSIHMVRRVQQELVSTNFRNAQKKGGRDPHDAVVNTARRMQNVRSLTYPPTHTRILRRVDRGLSLNERTSC